MAASLRGLPDHALLDRIIRGRAWIPILGVLLVGIVAMQVEVLKLNAGIGRSLERSSALQSQNELLRAGVARLSDEQRIERIAAGMGMVMPSPDQMRFVRTGSVGVQRALNGIKAPDATSFVAQLPTIGAPAAAQGASTNTGVGTTPTAAAGAAGTATGAAGTATGAAGTATGAAGTATGATVGGTAATTGTASTASTAAASTSGAASTSQVTPAPTQSTGSASTPTTTAPATSAPITATGGTTGQSTSSSTGGATPVGG